MIGVIANTNWNKQTNKGQWTVLYIISKSNFTIGEENFVVAPMWGTASDGSVPSRGRVFYRERVRMDDQVLFELQADINKSTDMQSIGEFEISNAFMATFSNIENPLDNTQLNQYQVG